MSDIIKKFMYLVCKKFPNNTFYYRYDTKEDMHIFVHDIDFKNLYNHNIMYILIENILYYNQIYNIVFVRKEG